MVDLINVFFKLIRFVLNSPSNVTVCPGVKIGKNCVIGAGSVVTKDIPDNSLALGVPAKVIRQITDQDHLNNYPY